MSKKQKKRKGFLDYLLTLIMAAAFGVFLYAGYNLLIIQNEYKEGEDTYKQMQEYVHGKVDTPNDEQMSETNETELSEPLEAVPELEAPIVVDFQQLQEVNEDIVGWIYMEAIPTISYPIVQGEDNEYYLKHTVEGKRNSAASIFLDYRNMADYSDDNTIIYGHNMKNQSMFGLLKQYKNAETCAVSPYFWILTPERDYRYEIFSIREIGERDDVYSHLDFQEEELKAYLEQMQDHSLVSFEHVFDGKEKVITLSTCTTRSTKRCVVQGFRKDDVQY